MNEVYRVYPPHPQSNRRILLEAKDEKKVVSRTCAVPNPLF